MTEEVLREGIQTLRYKHMVHNRKPCHPQIINVTLYTKIEVDDFFLIKTTSFGKS